MVEEMTAYYANSQGDQTVFLLQIGNGAIKEYGIFQIPSYGTFHLMAPEQIKQFYSFIKDGEIKLVNLNIPDSRRTEISELAKRVSEAIPYEHIDSENVRPLLDLIPNQP